eukprot:CAMPEP_0180716452 /NCGR_PEP_ID=MMETSP1038_2-20121128/13463_1 /TAXON_ID=632150 /ORGANISM="Azadinium spinosum, Strain 3D9" /LENGTH=36 /DNA_ID= /DNA_START= /DNA_END= /DNA_ORIENTATION=
MTPRMLLWGQDEQAVIAPILGHAQQQTTAMTRTRSP